jgi:hypothetical protein
MEEQRGFFRIENRGEIHASSANELLEVINISSSGVLVVKKSNLPKHGILELSINNFSMHINYELLRVDHKTMALVFKNEQEINKLFEILKKLREVRTKHNPPPY